MIAHLATAGAPCRWLSSSATIMTSSRYEADVSVSHEVVTTTYAVEVFGAGLAGCCRGAGLSRGNSGQGPAFFIVSGQGGSHGS